MHQIYLLISFLIPPGCIVHAYDHTLSDEQKDKMMKNLHDNVHFHDVGISWENNEDKNVKTYKELLIENGDIGKEVTYFKVGDIFLIINVCTLYTFYLRKQV